MAKNTVKTLKKQVKKNVFASLGLVYFLRTRPKSESFPHPLVASTELPIEQSHN